MDIAAHLLANKILEIENLISAEVVIKLYFEMTEHAVFAQSVYPDAEVQRHESISEIAFENSFSDGSKALLNDFKKDLASMLGIEANQIEPWQCIRYLTGGNYDYHQDCGENTSNERLYTVMVTLRSPDFGGAMHFPGISKMVPSKAGSVMFWRNLDEDYLCDGNMFHAVMPVGNMGMKDEKMILITWVRRYEFVS